MKSRGTKTAALYRTWTPIRQAWLREEPTCCLCGGPACDVHELLAGAHRLRAFVERCCWLRVCRSCHDLLQHMPKHDQLALKLVTDPQNFDLLRFHEAWGRPPTAITAAEVLSAVRELLIRRQA